jgi:hypothetical protein
VLVIKREEKEGRKKAIGGGKYLTYPPNRKIDRQCPSKYHKLIKALHG